MYMEWNMIDTFIFYMTKYENKSYSLLKFFSLYTFAYFLNSTDK
jgi:hypothetical protein